MVVELKKCYAELLIVVCARENSKLFKYLKLVNNNYNLAYKEF